MWRNEGAACSASAAVSVLRSSMRFCVVVVVAIGLLSGGCQRPPAPPAPATSSSQPMFLHDDYQGALDAAARAGAVVFVDAWAPWCHTCLSMQRDVLSKPALAAFNDHVVFVGIDTDRPQNAAFLAAHPVSLWPTFLIVDPRAPQTPLAVNPGAMSLDATVGFIEGALARRANSEVVDVVTAALDVGHLALAAGDGEGAVSAFVKAAQKARPDHPRRQEAVVRAAWAFTKQASRAAECVAFVDAHAPSLTGGPAGDVLGAAARCIDGLTDPAQKTQAKQATRARLAALVEAPAVGASVDDQADVMATLADLLGEEANNADAVKALHERRLALLERDANSAVDVRGQQVHDYARMNSLFALGRGEEAVTLLAARAKAIPDDYEPTARLASALFRLKRHDEAKVHAERAVALAYGPRRLRYLTLLADIEEARGDVAARDRALQTIVKDGEALPAPLRLASVTDAAKARLAPAAPATAAP